MSTSVVSTTCPGHEHDTQVQPTHLTLKVDDVAVGSHSGHSGYCKQATCDDLHVHHRTNEDGIHWDMNTQAAS